MKIPSTKDIAPAQYHAPPKDRNIKAFKSLLGSQSKAGKLVQNVGFAETGVFGLAHAIELQHAREHVSSAVREVMSATKDLADQTGAQRNFIKSSAEAETKNTKTALRHQPSVMIPLEPEAVIVPQSVSDLDSAFADAVRQKMDQVTGKSREVRTAGSELSQRQVFVNVQILDGDDSVQIIVSGASDDEDVRKDIKENLLGLAKKMGVTVARFVFRSNDV